MESIVHNTACNKGLSLITLCHGSVPWFSPIDLHKNTRHWSKAAAAARRSAPAESLLVAQAAPTNSTPFVRQPDFPLCRLLQTSLLSLAVVSRDLDKPDRPCRQHLKPSSF